MADTLEITFNGDTTELPLPGESSVAAAALAAADRAEQAANTAAASVAAQVEADRIAAQQAALAAAASVPATADRTVGRRPNDTAIWSMIRATPALGFGPDGNLVETPIDALRWEFDPVTRLPLGAAFAGARTNRFTAPRDLANAAWRKNNLTASLTAAGAEGTANAASILTASAADAFVAQYASGSAAGPHGLSVMLRRRTGTGDVRLSFGQTTGGVGVGPNMVNGTFDAATGWTLGTGWSITGGQLVLTSATAGQPATSALPSWFTPGIAYEITYTVVSVSGGGVIPRFDGGTQVEGALRGSPGTYTDILRPNGTNTIFRFFPLQAGVNAVIDNVTVRPYMQAPVALTSNWQRFSLGVDTTTSARPHPALAIYLATSGDQIDVDFAQGEPGPFVSDVIPATGTRAQGNVTIPAQQLGARLSRRQGLIILDWSSQPGAFTSALDAEWLGLVAWGDTTANERMGLLINPAHTSIQARCTAGGVVQTASAVTITAPTAGQTIRAALAWDLDAGFMQVAARGVAGTKVALTAAPAVLSNLMPGRFATSNPLFGRIQGLDCRPAALFDAALAALT